MLLVLASMLFIIVFLFGWFWAPLITVNLVASLDQVPQNSEARPLAPSSLLHDVVFIASVCAIFVFIIASIWVTRLSRRESTQIDLDEIRNQVLASEQNFGNTPDNAPTVDLNDADGNPTSAQ